MILWQYSSYHAIIFYSRNSLNVTICINNNNKSRSLLHETKRDKYSGKLDIETLTSGLQILYLVVQTFPLHGLRLHRRCCREIPPPHVLKE